jgi:glutamine amidotransferase
VKRDVVLVDGGGTNIGSVRYALQRLGCDADLSADPARVRRATHVILPGVGAAGPGMSRLRDAGLVEVLRELRQPLLGVCLGMQLLFERSEESDTPCLGLLPGTVREIPRAPGRRVPHMGWNDLQVERADPLLDNLAPASYAYFVHSYAAPLGAATIASCTYGDAFSAVVRVGNVCGMQFHPERSATVGARLLGNFLEL